MSVFTRLNKNFVNLYQLLNCADCKRKIDVRSKCVECDSQFCTECLFQMKKTKMCKSCKASDSIKEMADRNEFVNDLLDLVQMFNDETDQKIIKDDFFSVESAENLERIFNKEKTNVFNQAQFQFATSTPTHNTRRVNFQNDITMIPPNAKNKQVVESAEKVNSKNKLNNTTSSTSSTSGKRKSDSITEKNENNSRSKKAKLTDEQPAEKEMNNEIAKETEVDQAMESDKQPELVANKSTDKPEADKLADKQTDKQQTKETANVETIEKNNTLNNNQQIDKKIDEQTDKQTDDKMDVDQLLEFKELKQQLLQENAQLVQNFLDAKNQLEKRLLDEKAQYEQKLAEDKKQLEQKLIDDKKQLDQKLIDDKKFFEQRLIDDKDNFKESTIQLIKEQMIEMNKLNAERVEEMIVVGLTKIIADRKIPITSSIQVENIGKVNFTIEPFKEIERPKKILKNFKMQTDEIKTNGLYVQTEPIKLNNQSTNTDLKRYVDAITQCERMELGVNVKQIRRPNNVTFNKPVAAPANVTQSQEEIRQIVDTVVNGVNETNGKPAIDNKENGDLNMNKKQTNQPNKSNYSIQFDESTSNVVKDVNEKKEEVIDSDELKKHVGSESIFDSDEDEVGASSPIYE